MKILHTQISAAAMIKELKFCARVAEGHNGYKHSLLPQWTDREGNVCAAP
jgi:hypothetical protein